MNAPATLMHGHPTPENDDGVGTTFTDEELTALALSADPDQPLDPDAVPFTGTDVYPGLLPDWYMPAPVARLHKRWHIAVVLWIIAAFGLISGLGLCITYGHLVVA